MVDPILIYISGKCLEQFLCDHKMGSFTMSLSISVLKPNKFLYHIAGHFHRSKISRNTPWPNICSSHFCNVAIKDKYCATLY